MVSLEYFVNSGYQKKYLSNEYLYKPELRLHSETSMSKSSFSMNRTTGGGVQLRAQQKVFSQQGHGSGTHMCTCVCACVMCMCVCLEKKVAGMGRWGRR